MLTTASVTFAGQVYQLVMTVISGFVIARLIGPGAYGTFNLARTVCETTTLVTKSGFDIGVIRFLGEARRPGTEFSATATCRRILAAVGALGLVPIAFVVLGGGNLIERNVYQHADFALILLVVSLSIPFLSILQVTGGIFRGFLRITPRVVAELVVQPTLRLLLFLGLFAVGLTLWAVVWATVASYAIAAALILVWAMRTILPPVTSSPGSNRRAWTEVATVGRYSAIIAASTLMATLLGRLDTIFLGYYVNSTVLGQYAAAQMVAGLLGAFNIALAQAAAPLIAGLGAERRRDEMGTVLHQHSRWVTIATVPMFLVLFCYGDSVILLLGSNYLTDAPVLAVLAAAQLIQAVLSSSGYALSMTGRHTTEMRVMIFGVAACLLLSVLLIPRAGILGAALSTLGGITTANLIRAWAVRQVVGRLPLGVDSLWPALIGLVVFAAFYGARAALTDSPGSASALLAAVGSLLAYAAIILAVGLSAAEKTSLLAVWARLLGRNGRPSTP